MFLCIRRRFLFNSDFLFFIFQSVEPNVEDFQKLLDENIETFHRCRTAETLEDHWRLLRHYSLLSCQPGENLSDFSLTRQPIWGKLDLKKGSSSHLF